jgi:hypothetical protein
LITLKEVIYDVPIARIVSETFWRIKMLEMFKEGVKLLENTMLCQLAKTVLLKSLVANGFDRAFFDGRQASRFIGWSVWLSKNVAFS